MSFGVMCEQEATRLDDFQSIVKRVTASSRL